MEQELTDMEQEIKDIIKTEILKDLNNYYRKCKNYVFYIGNDVMRVISKCGEHEFQQIYIDPLRNAMWQRDYVENVCVDFRLKFNRWIMAQYRGW